jgi:hypothetical protein
MILRQILIAVMCILTFAFAAAQQREEVTAVEFTSFTRGFQKQAFFSSDSIIQITNKRGVISVAKRKIDSLEWEKLNEQLKDVNFAKMKELPAPSARRTFDGAMHSTITIVTGTGLKYEHTFDDEFPHEKLYPLMQAIKALIGEDASR